MARAAPFGARPCALIAAACLHGRTSAMQDPAGRALAISPNARLEVAELHEDLTSLVQTSKQGGQAVAIAPDAELASSELEEEDLMSFVQTSVQTSSKAAASRDDHSGQASEEGAREGAHSQVNLSSTRANVSEVTESQQGVVSILSANSTAPGQPNSIPEAYREDQDDAASAPSPAADQTVSLLQRPDKLAFTTDPALRPLRYLLFLCVCAVLLPLAYAVIAWRNSGDRGAAKALEVLQPVKFDGDDDAGAVGGNASSAAGRELDAEATAPSSEAAAIQDFDAEVEKTEQQS